VLMSCSICLSSFRDPVCIPCGHVYCKRCLTDYANAPGYSDLTAKCPECRASFDLVLPDLTYLPEKYHKFVTHSVRRVYVDSSSTIKELRESLKAAEIRLARKESMEQALLKRSEELVEAVTAHRQGERDANLRILELEEEIMTLEDDSREHDSKVKDLQKMHALILDKLNGLEKSNQVLQSENIRLSLNYHDIRAKLKEKDPNIYQPASSKKHRKGHDANSMSPATNSSASSVFSRPTKPLPKRRAIKQRLIGDSSFVPIGLSDFI